MLIGMAAAGMLPQGLRRSSHRLRRSVRLHGGGAVGVSLARVLEIWHWNGFFVVISVAAGVSALLLLPLPEGPGTPSQSRRADSRAGLNSDSQAGRPDPAAACRALRFGPVESAVGLAEQGVERGAIQPGRGVPAPGWR